jgi:hypothetical protein
MMTPLHHAIFPPYAASRWVKLDFNLLAKADSKISTSPNNPLIDPIKCGEWVDSIHRANNADFSYGGWMEDRACLWRGHYQKDGKTTHVGVDYNVPAGTLVRLPQAGRLIMVEEDPDQDGGWGTRLIFKIGDLFVTFAHLWMPCGTVGSNYQAGYPFAEVANHKFNGGWFPHLHLQVQRKFEPYKDGYQLYTDELEVEYPNPESVLCPNPLVS